jgi:hypothetical protein
VLCDWKVAVLSSLSKDEALLVLRCEGEMAPVSLMRRRLLCLGVCSDRLALRLRMDFGVRGSGLVCSVGENGRSSGGVEDEPLDGVVSSGSSHETMLRWSPLSAMDASACI